MPDEIRPCVYILASRRRGALYVGVTRDLLRRMWLHREEPTEFCARYDIGRLVWYGPRAGMADAIAHEKRLKRWRRQWKFELIEAANPDWADLYLHERGVLVSPGPGSPLRGVRDEG